MGMDWEAIARHRATEPSAAGLCRLAAAVAGRGAEVGGVRRLHGGVVTATHAVEVRGRGRRPLRLVVKRYAPGDGTPPSEWERLGFAAMTNVASPQPVAVDLDGVWFGTPALVMTRLRGRPNLSPGDGAAWLDSLGRAILPFHAADTTGAPPSMRRPHRSGTWRPGPYVGRSTLWTRAYAALADLLPRSCPRPVALHDDLHAANVLLGGDDRVCGIVDWSAARLGPAAFDIAECRASVAVFAGPAAADRVRRAYEAEAGPLEDLPVWDLFQGVVIRENLHNFLPGWRAIGLESDTRLLRSRLRDFTSRALAEL